ncbi:MAG TPA: heavy metal translocating P-type ATPase [Gemmatimonadaceae bacterium]|nr:heavy metal translocating P-type ATPase [Gemmatimonadaceae bacterium]
MRSVPELAAGWHTLLTILAIAAGAPLVWRTVRRIVRGQFAADIVASIAIVAGILLGEPIAALVVIVMQSGGEALERRAERRASAAVRELEAAAPRIAHRLDGTQIHDVPAREVAVGDLLLVRPGELVPCNGEIVQGSSDLDESRLTGEPMPRTVHPGALVMSGSGNGASSITIRATARAADSEYEQIVALVRTAQQSKAPLQRLADRWAVWFTPFTLAVCLVTFVATGEWDRVLAVLVIATPCPLILAPPVAIIGGINSAARRRIIVRNGAAMERLSTVTTAAFDKTGTLTVGRPSISAVAARPPFFEDEVLVLAGALEGASGHMLARVVSDEAARRYGALPVVEDHRESAGEGIVGTVAGRRVAVGGRRFVASELGTPTDMLGNGDGAARLRAYVAVDGRPAGTIAFADAPRPATRELAKRLRSLGVRRTLLLSGDSHVNARAVGDDAGISDVRGDLLPADKDTIVAALRREGETVAMVGDGINDAPALSRADVGIALAAHGGGISAEAADVVVLADDIGRVADAIAIGKRTMRLARQSVVAGLVLSGVGMIVAALGFLPPVAGALVQEGIDLAVIVNALRASR